MLKDSASYVTVRVSRGTQAEAHSAVDEIFLLVGMPDDVCPVMGAGESKRVYVAHACASRLSYVRVEGSSDGSSRPAILAVVPHLGSTQSGYQESRQ